MTGANVQTLSSQFCKEYQLRTLEELWNKLEEQVIH